MAKNYKKMAAEILKEVGGEENINSLTHCMTRLRFKLKDEGKADDENVKNINGVIQVIKSGGQYQVVIGTDVGDVYDEIMKVTNLAAKPAEGEKKEEAQEAPKEKKGFINAAIDLISGIFLPFMSAFMAAGLLKGFLVLFTTAGWMDPEGTTYAILYAIADGVFTFLPVFLAYTAADKFKADKFVSVAVASALVYPNITELFNSGAAVTFAGIPVKLISYPSSVIPIIVAVFIQSKLEAVIKPRIPQVVRGIIVPLVSLLATSLITFLVIGPVTNVIATGLADGINYLLNICPPVAGALLGLIYPIMLIFGLHWGLIPIVLNNYATLGGDNIFPITLATNFAIAGCTLGILLKTKNAKLKEVSASTFVSALIGGITEPALYGVVLKYKKPFVIVCVLDAIGGVLMATFSGMQTAMISTCLLTAPALVAMLGKVSILVMCLGFFGGVILTYLFGYSDKMLAEEE